MPFIGNQPALSYTSFAKQDFTTSVTTSYTLDNPVANANELALFINFVRQEPTTAYSASGTSLTLTSATSASDDMYCVFLGKAVQTVNPPNSSVGSSQVSADLITGQTALGSTPADTDELLISDAGTLKRVDYSYLKSANTPAFSANIPSNVTSQSWNSTIVLSCSNEIFDTDSAYDPTTNYRFTVPSGKAGKYFINLFGGAKSESGGGMRTLIFNIRVNGSNQISYQRASGSDFMEDNQDQKHTVSAVLNLSESDYVDATIYAFGASGTLTILAGTTLSGYKLIGV
jgi:hypothetical protein